MSLLSRCRYRNISTVPPPSVQNGSQHPDEFVENLFDLDAAAVVAAAQRQRAQLKNPPINVDRYLEILFRQGLVQTTKALATYRAIL